MITDKITQSIAEAYKKMKEELVGGQKKLDINKNERIDSQDLAILRAKNEELEEGHPENLKAIEAAAKKSPRNLEAGAAMQRRVEAAMKRKKHEKEWQEIMKKEEIEQMTEGYAVVGVRKNKPHLPGFVSSTRHVNGNISSINLSRGNPSKIFDSEDEAKAHISEINSFLSTQRGHGWGPLTIKKVRGKATTTEEFESLDEMASSKSQRRLFALVDQVQQGKMKAPSKEIADLAKSMSPEEVKKFARTKETDLPNHVGEEKEEQKPKLPPHLIKLLRDKGLLDSQLKDNPIKHTIRDVTPKGYGPNEETEIEEAKKSPWSKLEDRLNLHGYNPREVLSRKPPGEKKEEPSDEPEKEKTNEELSRSANIVKEVFTKAREKANVEDPDESKMTKTKPNKFNSEPEADILPTINQKTEKNDN